MNKELESALEWADKNSEEQAVLRLRSRKVAQIAAMREMIK